MSLNDLWNSEEFLTSILVGCGIVFGILIIVAIVKSHSSKTTTNYNSNYLSSNESSSTKVCRNCGCYVSPTASTCSNCGTPTRAKMQVTDSSSQWKCPNCGKVHQNYVGTCGCGTRKP